METDNSISSGGSVSQAPQTSSFEARTIQEFNSAPVQGETIFENSQSDRIFSESQGEADAREIMDEPGTAHKKLEALANSDDDRAVEPEYIEKGVPQRPVVSMDNKPDSKDFDQEFEGLTPEQKIMMMQLEIIKMLVAQRSNKKAEKPKVDPEEMIKKLQKLLEENEGDGKQPKNSVLINTIMGAITLLTTLTEYKGENN
ncbi:MAG: hypothetical protein A3A51_01810 [Candidatus Levybacteria bacterium RIFCSPLOWO2_01_FULL_39_10]|nr:MAG: hypothetical protein A3A51_01810 [Candidatus Levybacteria bacterium RIFCSPLOWO2_01_FULL_39_10]